MDTNAGTPVATTPEVVVGVDGTATALRAVVWAADEARVRGTGLRIVHAAPYATPTSPAAHRRADAILAAAHSTALRREPDVTVRRTGLVDDQPVPALLAASDGSALLVVGMAGGRPGEVVLGSVAVAVSGRARGPVVVVRGHHRSSVTGRPVLLGVADPAADAPAIEAAFADADRHGTRIVVLHVHPAHLGGPDPEPERLHEALAPWRARHPGVPVDVRITHGHPDEQLLLAAAEARLVVVSTRGHGAAARLLLGSCSRMLVTHSPCPVCVVRGGPGPDAVPAMASVPASSTGPDRPW